MLPSPLRMNAYPRHCPEQWLVERPHPLLLQLGYLPWVTESGGPILL